MKSCCCLFRIQYSCIFFKIDKESGLSCKEFILQAYENNYNEEFELKVRQYLVEKNIPIHNNNAKKY